MPEYLSPAVYMEEVSGGIKPIEGVSTSTAAFVGQAVKGPVDEPTLVTSITQFQTTFGGFHQDYYLAYAVRNFFLEGGSRCYIVRAFKPTTDNHPEQDACSATFDSLTVQASSPGTWGQGIWVKILAPSIDPNDKDNKKDPKFKLVVGWKDPAIKDDKIKPTAVETFDRLSMKKVTDAGLANPNYVPTVVNGISGYIAVSVADPPAGGQPPAPPAGGQPPAPPAGGQPPANTEWKQLTGGKDSQALGPADFIGGAPDDHHDKLWGLYAFDKSEDINIVAIPDLWAPGVKSDDSREQSRQGMVYCDNRKDCFFIADPPPGLKPTGVRDYKQAMGAFSAGNGFDSSYAALYYPWIWITDPLTGKRMLFPPSASIAGIYARTDVERGVHKAPAGTDNGRMRTAVDVERIVTKGEHDILNPEGINVIRKFAQSGITVWGARTISADPEWKYLNVRRLFIFLEQSILRGTQWVVFEPNDVTLWSKIKRNVTAFLRIQWIAGMLVGEKPELAFFVKCDAETNPQDSIDLGRVITIIGVRPSKPAEFVIFRIMQTRPGESA